MAQIIRITSEALQSTIRRLLPSQQGFGEDLQASNVIQPIIDLTPTAEGSALPDYLQTALSMDSQTAFSQVGTGSSNAINTAGFFRMQGVATIVAFPAVPQEISIDVTDGLSTKKVWAMQINVGSNSDLQVSEAFDLNFYVNAGETVQVTCDAHCTCIGSSRQLATTTGELVNPAGFTPQ